VLLVEARSLAQSATGCLPLHRHSFPQQVLCLPAREAVRREAGPLALPVLLLVPGVPAVTALTDVFEGHPSSGAQVKTVMVQDLFATATSSVVNSHQLATAVQYYPFGPIGTGVAIPPWCSGYGSHRIGVVPKRRDFGLYQENP